MKDFFDPVDANKDGKITRDEWDAVLKFMAEGVNVAFAVKPGGSGDVSKSHVAWKKTKGLPYIASAIVYKGLVVMVRDGGFLSAYDVKTGKDVFVMDRSAAPTRYYASPVAANGHIYFTGYEDGTVTVLKAGETSPDVVAKNPKLGEKVGATPAIADDTLYIRTEKHLYAFSEKK
jgi:outer membrane protein assembly factor BamB